MQKFLVTSLIILFSCILSFPVLAERFAYAPDRNLLLLANAYGGMTVMDLKNDVQPFLIKKTFNDIAYANGLFVAVGNFNAIVTSHDGNNWVYGQGPDLNGNGNLNAVSYIANKWVAVGSYKSGGWGGVFTSEDGKNWINRAKGARFINLNALADDGKQNFVAVGKRMQYIYSHDGGRTIFSGKLPGIEDFHDVAYGKGVFVAVGGLSTIYYSNNGKDWTPVNIPDSKVSFNKITYVPDMDKFILVGGASYKGLTTYTSNDGKTWTRLEDRINKYHTSLTAMAFHKQDVFVGGYANQPPYKGAPRLFRFSTHTQSFLPVTTIAGRPIEEPLDAIIGLPYNGGFFAASFSFACENYKQYENIIIYNSISPDIWAELKILHVDLGERCGIVPKPTRIFHL